ncbi:MAG: single-stranded DNA-binding protein [Anaerolineae bacterium]|nr:single-stranded DNA-binding protein [Anaerolineae bacterium]
MYQKLVIVGHLGTDPDLRYTSSGQSVCSFSVATNRRWSGSDGQVQEETVWFRVSVWGRQAETCNQYLAKGRQVLCEGRLTIDRESGGPRVWQAQDGKWRASYEMTAFEIKFLSGGGRGDDYSSNGGSQSSVPDNSPGITEDEIPF